MQSDATPLFNPFAMLNLSADATAAQIKNAAKEAIFRQRLDKSAVDEQLLRKLERAAELLKDPVSRFEHGLFWVKLNQEERSKWKQDAILSNLGNVWDISCVERYEQLKLNADLSLYSENMAVLTLGCAMHLSDQMTSPAKISECEQMWKSALQRWSIITNQSEYWGSLLVQCVKLGDPRLNSDYVQKWRNGLSLHLLRLCQSKASDALLGGNRAVAQSFVGVIRSSAFTEFSINETLRQVYSPLCKLIQSELGDYEKKLGDLDREMNRQSGYKDRSNEYRSLLSEFQKKTYPRLEMILSIGDLPGLEEERARDESARFLRSFSISVFNELDDKVLAESALDLASKVVDSEAMSAKLKADKSAVEFNSVANKAMVLVEGNNFVEAIRLVEEESRNSSQSVELIQLSNKIKSAYAVHCFKKAVDCLEIQEWVRGEEWLRIASTYEKNPENLAVIHMAQKKVKQVRKQAGSSSSCFVATATFQTPHHDTVVRLRAYRDEVLSGNCVGRSFIKLYWLVGPSMAWCVRRVPITRRVLSPSLTWLANILDGNNGKRW